MKTFSKRCLAFLLVISFLFCGTSCSSDNSYINYENPLADLTVTEMMEQAKEIAEDIVYQTEEGNSFSVQSVKKKGVLVSGLASVLAVVLMIVTLGSFIFTPGMDFPAKGHKFIETKVKYTNHTSETVRLGDVLHVGFYAGEDKEEEVDYLHAAYYNFGSIYYGLDREIEPGKSLTFRLMAEVPKEMIKSGEQIDIYFDIDGELYTVSYQ